MVTTSLRRTLPTIEERPPGDYRVDALAPQLALRPRSAEEVAALLAGASAQRLTVVPQGSRTAMSLGRPLRTYDVALDLTALDEVIAYEPDDLTVTVGAGITLARLNALLGEHGQELPADPPPDDRVTIGGMLATAKPGARRGHHPAPRDLVVGMQVAMADGQLARSGGRVVKNVSGYDLHRLHTGALGALGVIVEASFKVTPRPAERRSYAVRADSLQHAGTAALALWARALPTAGLSVLGTKTSEAIGLDAAPQVLVEFGGGASTVARCAEELHAVARSAGAFEPREVPRTHWSRLRALAGEATDGGSSQTIVRMGVPATQLVETIEAVETAGLAWGHLAAGSVLAKLSAPDAATIQQLRARAEALGGFLQIEAAPPQLRSAVDPFGGVERELVAALKREFDPAGTLNPGRWQDGV